QESPNREWVKFPLNSRTWYMARYWNSENGIRPGRAYLPAAIYLLAAACLLATACRRNDTGRIDGMIERVKEQYAPDKRTVVFTVSAEKRGRHALISGETSSSEAKTSLFALLDSAGLETIDSVRVLPG